MTNKTKKNWMTAGKLLMYSVLFFAAATWIVANYEEWIRKFNWAMVSIICGVGFAAFWFYRLTSQSNTFDPLDLILDPITRRVSPWRVIVLGFACIGAWTLVQWVIKDKPAGDIIQLFTILLGAFVSKLVSGDFADALAKRNPAVACEPNDAFVPSEPTPPEPGPVSAKKGAAR